MASGGLRVGAWEGETVRVSLEEQQKLYDELVKARNAENRERFEAVGDKLRYLHVCGNTELWDMAAAELSDSDKEAVAQGAADPACT